VPGLPLHARRDVSASVLLFEAFQPMKAGVAFRLGEGRPFFRAPTSFPLRRG